MNSIEQQDHNDAESAPPPVEIPAEIVAKINAYRFAIRQAATERQRRTGDQMRELNDAERDARASLDAAIAEVVSKSRRWEYFRQFLSVEEDATLRGQYLFLHDDRVSDVTFAEGYEHTVESLVDRRIAATPAPRDGQ